MTTSSLYQFNGSKVIEHTHYQKFISQLKSDNVEIEAHSLKELFENLRVMNSPDIHIASKVLFEHVFYGDQKHMYYYSFKDEAPTKVKYTQVVNEIINELNKAPQISSAYYSFFSSDGFYLLDRLDVNKSGATFILGFDYEESNNLINRTRFLIAQVARKEGRYCYNLCSLEINFEKQLYFIMFHNMNGLEKIDDDLLETENVWDNTINKYMNTVNQKILDKFIKQPIFDYIEDRKAMFQMCKDLDNVLLDEYRVSLTQMLGEQTSKDVEKWMKKIFVNNKYNTDYSDKLKRKIDSQLLSIYLMNNDSIDLIEKSMNLKQVGYTTRIEFSSDLAGSSATKSRNAEKPIAAEDMFHSLYIDFHEALELPKWSMAWFTNNPNKPKDYVQTTIHTTTTHFKVLFKCRRHLDERMIYHVIDYLHKYRIG